MSGNNPVQQSGVHYGSAPGSLPAGRKQLQAESLALRAADRTIFPRLERPEYGSPQRGVGIVGGTGYTGVELLRILVNHPEVSLQVITSRSEEGTRVDDMYPNLRGHTDLVFSVPDAETLGECDVVFFATPHGVAHALAGEILKAGTRVIDLSADFRE